MSIDRRQFNQGLIATAVAVAIPLLPTPPQVEGSWHAEMVPIDDLPFPEFVVRLLERSAHTDLYQIENLTDLVLRIQGYSHVVELREPVYVIELGPRGTYEAFIPSHWEPRFELLAQYRWTWS